MDDKYLQLCLLMNILNKLLYIRGRNFHKLSNNFLVFFYIQKKIDFLNKNKFEIKYMSQTVLLPELHMINNAYNIMVYSHTFVKTFNITANADGKSLTNKKIYSKLTKRLNCYCFYLTLRGKRIVSDDNIANITGTYQLVFSENFDWTDMICDGRDPLVRLKEQTHFLKDAKKHIVDMKKERDNMEYKLEQWQCLVCFVGDKQIVNLPCCHLTECATCSEKLSNLSKCIICYQMITGKIKFYNS